MKLSRLVGVVATPIFLFSAAVFVAAPAGSVSAPSVSTSTASMAGNDAGDLVVTYAGTTDTDSIFVLALPEGTPCSDDPVIFATALFYFTTNPSFTTAPLGTSPAVISPGRSIFGLVDGIPTFQRLQPGRYNFCLQSVDSSLTPGVAYKLQELVFDLGVSATPTTLPPEPEAAPATPAFTG